LTEAKKSSTFGGIGRTEADMKSRQLIFSLLIACGSAGAFAQPSLEDSLRIRQAIEGQWDAFSRDDAEGAFSFASPEIHELFASPDGFLAMVRDGYPMVYRHTTVKFLAPRILGPFAFQTVRMSDEQGSVWLVRYQLRRQADSSWRISGVRALPGAGVPALEPAATAS
jgi:hypothetical protein